MKKSDGEKRYPVVPTVSTLLLGLKCVCGHIGPVVDQHGFVYVIESEFTIVKKGDVFHRSLRRGDGVRCTKCGVWFKAHCLEPVAIQANLYAVEAGLTYIEEDKLCWVVEEARLHVGAQIPTKRR